MFVQVKKYVNDVYKKDKIDGKKKNNWKEKPKNSAEVSVMK